MAITFPTSADFLSRTANLPTVAAFTIAGWAKRTADLNDYGTIANLVELTGFTGAQIGPASDGTTLQIANNVDLAGEQNFASSPAQDQWFYFALIGTGTGANQLLGYWKETGGTVWKTVQETVANITPQALYVGSFDGFAPFQGSVCCVRCWNAALSESELNSEWVSTTAVRTSNINFDWRLLNNSSMTDQSGNGRNPTVDGSPGNDASEPAELAAAGGTAMAVFRRHYQRMKAA